MQNIIYHIFEPTKNVKLPTPLKQIVEELGKLNVEFGDYCNKPLMTKEVKIAISNIGHDYSHKVYSRIFTKTEWKSMKNRNKVSNADNFKNVEWLYDIHWYRDLWNKKKKTGEKYTPISFELACECEWSKDKATDFDKNLEYIGYDFQKLLFSNAKINVFVCRAHKTWHSISLLEYFINAIQNFKQLHYDTPFLIICYDREVRKMKYYVERVKN